MLTYIWIFTLFFLVISILYYLLHLDEPSTRINSNVPVRKEKIREKHSSFEIDGRKKATHADGTSYETNDNEITGNWGSSVDDDRHVDTLERHFDRPSIEIKPQHKHEPVTRPGTSKSTTEFRQRKQIIENSGSSVDNDRHVDTLERNFNRPSNENKTQHENEPVTHPEFRQHRQNVSSSIRKGNQNATVEQDEDHRMKEFENITEDEDMKAFQSYVDEKLLYDKIKRENALLGTFDYINENISKWKEQKVNIALSGGSGVGKSSLINALRGMKPSDKGAAGVGVIETTYMPKPYAYPQNCNVILWDLPGMGTPNFQKQNYLEKINYRKFDVFIIVFATRFLENDLWLAEQVNSRGKPVMFVRTKIDSDLNNAKEDYPDAFNEERILSDIRNEINKNLSRKGLQTSFLVSSKKTELYDFQMMNEKLMSLLKQKGITLSKLIYVLVKKHMETFKETVCKDHFKVRKVVAHLLCFLPEKADAGLCNIFVQEIHELCLKWYGLDDTSLKKIMIEDTSLLNNAEAKEILSKLFSEKYEVRENISFLIFGFTISFTNFFRSGSHLVNNIPMMCKLMEHCLLHLVKLRLVKLQDQLEPLK